MKQGNLVKIYLVEDNGDLLEEILFGLSSRGLDAQGFASGEDLYRAMAGSPCDIVILDVGLPGDDGFAIAAHLGTQGRLGIVFLTARMGLDDRLRGLSSGADAYLVKPIDIDELVATLLAVGKRRAARLGNDIRPLEKSIEWRLEENGWRLWAPDDKAIELSGPERTLMQQLFATPMEMVSRGQLIRVLSAGDPEYDPHRIESIISRLRKRCELAGLPTLPLKTVRGVGYLISP